MTAVAVVGDATTTTTVALAAGWPNGDDVIVLEADPSGGSLAGWLDTPSQPSLATIVANVGADSVETIDRRFATFDAMTQHSGSGVRFVANAVRSRARTSRRRRGGGGGPPGARCRRFDGARRCRRPSCGHRAVAALDVADVVVLVHRQATASAAAATVRVERLVESVEDLARLDADDRAGRDRQHAVRARRDRRVRRRLRARGHPNDDGSWRTIRSQPPRSPGGRVCRHERLRRLPLMRDAVQLASVVSELVDARRSDAARTRAAMGEMS